MSTPVGPYILSHPVTNIFEGEALDALNRHRQVCHAARQTIAGSEDERETARLPAASDLAGWVGRHAQYSQLGLMVASVLREVRTSPDKGYVFRQYGLQRSC